MESEKKIVNDFSAKIKNIYLELHNYSFFHNPSEIGNIDNRFIGREHIIKRLTAILTSNETKSGAYLVAGYRGMGKSSFVNYVLSKISSGYGKSKRLPRFFRIFLILSLLSLINNIFAHKVLLFYLPLIFLLIIPCFYLIYTDKKRDNLHFRKDRILISIKAKCISILRSLIIEKELTSEMRLRAFISDLFIISIIHLISQLIIIIFFNTDDLTKRYVLYLFIYSIYIILLFFLNPLDDEHGIQNTTSKESERKRYFIFFLPFKYFFRRILKLLQYLRRYINYSHRFYINISLGYDNLREIDILRLIAKNIHSRYEKIMGFTPYSFPFLLWQFLRTIIIFLIVGFLYYYQPFFQVYQNLKSESSICKYFPSQMLPILQNDKFHIALEKNILLDRDIMSLLAYKEFVKEELDRETELSGNIGKLNKNKELVKKIKRKKELLKNIIETPKYPFLQKCTYYLDQLVFISYSHFKVILRPSTNPNITYQVRTTSSLNDLYSFFGKRQLPGKKSEYIVSENFKWIPDNLDYLFILYLFLTWLFLRYLQARFRVFGFMTHEYIYSQILNLNERITAQVTNEKSDDIENSFSRLRIKISRRKSHKYPIASEREIETELIAILNNMDRIPRIMGRPQFIFIFDELDKIEPHKNITVHEKEEQEINDQFSKDELLFPTEGSRKRQHTILSIMANMKHFLTTAKSKFIFIAGHEMYDAALADVSDRHFFMGSIFNDVIYVNSFMSDPSNRRLSDITSMTETYVCSFLLPKKYKSSSPSLHDYKNYLENFFKKENDNDENAKQIRKEKIEKILISLNNFIVYITYRSNGAPKKITQLFERYICSFDKERLIRSEESLCVGRNSNNLYLFFGYYDQYTFDMITYLANPLILSINKSIRDFGDKLLVSSSFLVDHIYKFHKFGFSWRNLELMPEILDIHKAPNLRELIQKIITFLSYTHINIIVSGLYNFKFHKKIVEEISFLSKISDKEAAAFNFTLDESLSIKRHYHKRLQALKRDYQKIPAGNDSSQYIHSLGYIHMILGDLHFYDEEYDDALIEYMEAVQTIRHINVKQPMIEIYLFILIIRNMLKLGFTFEKKKIYDSAFMTYGKLTSIITNFREINLQEIGLKEVKLNKDKIPKDNPLFIKSEEEIDQTDWLNTIVEMGDEDYVSSEIGSNYKQKFKQIINDEICPRIISNRKSKLHALSNKFMELLKELPFSPKKEDIIFKISLFEGMRLVYQPFLAKLHTIEKLNLGGITLSDVELICREFEYLIKTIDRKEKFIINAEFNNRIGNILFYKNCRYSNMERFCNSPYIIHNPCIHYDSANNNKVGKHTPCMACGFYRKSLVILAQNFLGIDKLKFLEESKPFEFIVNKMLDYVCKQFFEENSNAKQPNIINFSRESNTSKSLANTLSYLGDILLSCLTKDDTFEDNFLIQFLNFMKSSFKEKSQKYLEIWKTHNFKEIEKIFFYYYLSAIFFRNAGERKEYAFQLTKILHFLRNYLSINNKTFTGGIIEEIKDQLVLKAIKETYRAYHNTHWIEKNKINEFIEMDPNKMSISFDIKEIIFIFQEIKLRRSDGSNSDLLKEYTQHMLGSYKTINSMYNRMIELRIKAKINYKFFTSTNKQELQDLSKELKLSDKESNEYLITDSIFCFHEIVKIANIFGISYMVNHSFLGFSHNKMAFWCNEYENHPNKKNLHDKLNSLIGESDTQTLSGKYHNEMAVHHFRLAHEMHSEGKAYREILEGIFYLNDDLNDNLSHFCAAIERYLINSGKTKDIIDKINDNINKSIQSNYGLESSLGSEEKTG